MGGGGGGGRVCSFPPLFPSCIHPSCWHSGISPSGKTSQGEDDEEDVARALIPENRRFSNATVLPFLETFPQRPIREYATIRAGGAGAPLRNLPLDCSVISSECSPGTFFPLALSSESRLEKKESLFYLGSHDRAEVRLLCREDHGGGSPGVPSGVVPSKDINFRMCFCLLRCGKCLSRLDRVQELVVAVVPAEGGHDVSASLEKSEKYVVAFSICNNNYHIQ